MKVPAVAIVAISACGFVLGLYFPVAPPYHLQVLRTDGAVRILTDG
jgi:hypothetical protein